MKKVQEFIFNKTFLAPYFDINLMTMPKTRQNETCKSKTIICFFMICLLAHQNAIGQFRKYSNEFLQIGAGARGLSMGNAQVASVMDATAGYWNPSRLVYIQDHPQVAVMHADYFAGIAKYDFLSLALPLADKKSTLGVSFLRFAIDDIPNTLFLVEPDGSLNYNNIQSFSSADHAVIFSYARKVKPIRNVEISWGANAKVIYRKVGSFAKAWGYGLDASFSASTDKWKIGAVLRDATSTFNAWSFNFTEREKQVLYLTNNSIPVQSTEITSPRMLLGATRKLLEYKKITLWGEFNAEMTIDGKRNTLIKSNLFNIDPRAGVEASLNKIFFVRAGIGNFQKGLADSDTLNQKKVWIFQPSIGTGFVYKNLTLDYALTNLANQENPLYSHVFSIRLNLIRKDEKKSP